MLIEVPGLIDSEKSTWLFEINAYIGFSFGSIGSLMKNPVPFSIWSIQQTDFLDISNNLSFIFIGIYLSIYIFWLKLIDMME